MDISTFSPSTQNWLKKITDSHRLQKKDIAPLMRAAGFWDRQLAAQKKMQESKDPAQIAKAAREQQNYKKLFKITAESLGFFTEPESGTSTDNNTENNRPEVANPMGSEDKSQKPEETNEQS